MKELVELFVCMQFVYEFNANDIRGKRNNTPNRNKSHPYNTSFEL